MNRKVSVAPMMDCTDRHERYFLRLISKNTVEGKILELQKKKRKIAEIALLDTGSAASITKDELLQLLQ